MTNLQHNLKYLRKNKGLIQADLSDKLGIDLKAYAKYEEGRSAPKIPLLISISDYYGISIDLLVREKIEDNLL